MLEESRMDKKSSNRSSQTQSRASAIDCKKSSDLTHHKPWPRNNKKREGAGTAPKNEQYRRNAPSQRGRGQVDRRSRPRGDNGYSVGGTQITGLEDQDEPEIGSVFVPGSKKQNLNHLLNFMYPSRGQAEGSGAGRGPGPQRRMNNFQRAFKHEHDLYLRAYCQFVVKEDGDYKLNILDPDVAVKWEQIEEVVVRSTGRSECPICLGAPVAGRVGLCGHVYCWACVLHYAAAHEKQPPPCPVCATPLMVKDMKPTKMVQWDSPAEEVTMRLVRRLRGSTVVEVAPPRGRLTELKAQHILPLHYINDSPYCKLFAASNKQVQDILEREKKEIETQILAEIDTTEIVFMEEALDMLKKKKESTISKDEPKLDDSDEEEAPIIYEKQEETNGNKLDWFDLTDDGAASVEIAQQLKELQIDSNLNPNAPEFNLDLDGQLEDLPLAEAECLTVKTEPDESDLTDIDKQNQAKYFYFYQAEDGQQVFLNSLNVRMLTASWGALVAAPPFIRGRVLHRETLPLIEQTRKHMPCTAHLPLHCSFDIVELELKPPNVTPATMKNFAEELDRRARNRARHERDERRRERAYRRAMEGPPRPDFSSDLVFPPASTTSYSSPPFEPSPLLAYDQACSSASVGSPPSSGLSFAKMASTSGTWRVRQSATAPPPPPPDDDDESSAPRALSLSDAIEAALHAGPSPSGKKNKKSKQKVLFTSGMQRDP